MIRKISDYFIGSKNTILLILAVFIVGSQAEAAEWLSVNPGVQPTEPTVILVEDRPDHLLIRWDLHGVYTNDIDVGGVKYKQVFLKTLMQVYNGVPGDPALPMLVEVIHVPDGMKGSVEVIDAKWVDIAFGTIIPQQLPNRDDGSSPLPFVINEDSYAQKDPFPIDLTSTNPPQGWGGIAVSSVAVTPVRYFPSENRIQYAASITVRVNFDPGIQNIVRPRRINPQMQKLHQIALLNPPDNNNQPADADENEVVRMLFIMKEEALETTQPLIDFHHKTGLRTEIIFSDDLPDDDEEAAGELKDLIRERFEEGLEYVQIIGDPDSNNWDVPMHHWDPEDPGAQDNNTDTHSDSWYICLDGPGEFGFEDHLPELAIGRLTYRSVDDLDELEIQIDKLVDYLWWDFEERDEVGWLNRAVLVGNYANVRGFDPSQEYLRCKRAIDNFEYELPAPEFITQYGDENDVNNATMIDIVNTGVGFFNYRGHGDEPRMFRWNRRNEHIRVNQVRQMENRNKPFLLVSSACLNASVATRAGDCLLESFQKHNGGSVSAHGSIISSYTISNSFFDEAIFQAWFDEGVYSLGYASNLAGTIMVLHFDQPFDRNAYNSLGRMNFRTYIWLGDPALQYRLGDQVTLAVDIPELILIATEFIDVTVLDTEDNPIDNSRICVRSEDDAIYQISITDANGVARIVFDPGMEEAGELFWAAQHRNGELVEGSIVVADGFGMIEGRILELGNEEAIPAAELRLMPFNVLAVSDNEGGYFFDGIPERQNYSITVSAEGFISMQRDGINVIDDEATVENFSLAYAELAVDDGEIEITLNVGESAETNVAITNIGTGELNWTSWLTDEYDLKQYVVIDNIELSLELEDRTINGIVLIDDHYYITGGNNFQDPNYIYKVDRESLMIVDRFEQPQATAGIGMHDLATDGEYIYGSARDIIYQLNLEGDVVSEIDGPYNPNVALTLDHDGNLWVGNNRSALIKIDLEGNVLQEIENSQQVRGLAWSPVAENGFNLIMMTMGEGYVPTFYHANPETEEVRLAHNLLEVEDGEIPADALFITNQYNPPAWTILGMVKYDILRYMRAWHLHYEAAWVDYSPESGRLEPDEEEDIILTFDASDLDDGITLSAVLGIENDGRVPLIEIQITMDIPLSVDSENNSTIPTEFGITGSYPNPFNAFTNIAFNIPYNSYVTRAVFDIHGRKVQALIGDNLQAGSHNVLLDGNLLSTGVYIVRIIADNNVSTRKIVLLK